MKSATIPSLRVTPAFRDDVESVLRKGESLSAFVEESLRQHVERRRMQKEFIARGLAARDKAKAAGQYASKEELMSSLQDILATQRKHG